jgi:anionic cell wall polymer biosynthesis LytR-Cps2A-Psr (LCP) family protein
VLISLGVLGLVLALLAGAGLWFLADRYVDNIDRVAAVLSHLDEEARPAPATPATPAPAEPVTFLLVGSDTRTEPAPGLLPNGRSEAIMLARFSADRQYAQLISIPRDSWVDIPGHGRNKINVSYASGGPLCSSRWTAPILDGTARHRGRSSAHR